MVKNFRSNVLHLSFTINSCILAQKLGSQENDLECVFLCMYVGGCLPLCVCVCVCLRVCVCVVVLVIHYNYTGKWLTRIMTHLFAALSKQLATFSKHLSHIMVLREL